MAESAAPPRLIKFVRRALRENPKPTFEDVLARWNASQGGTSDQNPALLRTVYDEELERASQPRPPRDPKHTRIVVVTIAIWILGNVAIALAIGLPDYVSCRAPTQGAASCGLGLGLTFLLVGVAQAVCGAVAAVIATRIRPPVAQGILIGLSMVLVLFTVVCFGATVSG